MRGKVSIVVILAGIVLAASLAIRLSTQKQRPEGETQPLEQIKTSYTPRRATEQPMPERPSALQAPVPSSAETPAQTVLAITNKLERLAQIREAFRALAAGDTASALHTAKQITNAVERETALLTLVTEWTHGELSDPQVRARNIAAYGLEAGLGMEMAKDPQLALLWANELTVGEGRAAVVREAAIAMVGSDPASAFSLSEQLPELKRPEFFTNVFAAWAGTDTDAALRWADQLQDPAEHDAAVAAIRTQAPVGIGALLAMKDGLPVINDLVPGTPAELSGQLHAGDRIVALAQGDNAFLDARNLSLQDVVKMVRGDPGTVLQLQVLAANASSDSPPRIVSIVRDQLKFKR